MYILSAQRVCGVHKMRSCLRRRKLLLRFRHFPLLLRVKYTLLFSIIYFFLTHESLLLYETTQRRRHI